MPKEDFARRDFYDVWLPELSPSAELVSEAMTQEWTPARWKAFERRYRAEMKQPAAEHLLATLAVLSRSSDFAVGCYCEEESRCHRSILRELLLERGATVQ